MNILDYIGYHGPTITIIINLVNLLDQKKYLASFTAFYLVEYYVVGMMKKLLKDPRPTGYLDKQYDDGGDYGSSILTSKHIGHCTAGPECFGMPSGHSSAVWYATVFLWLVKKSPYLLILDLALCFNTMYQRWAFRKHTVAQLFVGALVGGSIAWIAVLVTKQAVK